MTAWLLTPRDSLMVQDGRPCYAGQSLRTLDFPWPSSLAGFVRTTAGRDPKTGKFELTPQQARAIAIQGPFLVQTHADNKTPPVFFAPAPLDVLWQTAETEAKEVQRFRLAPVDDSLLPAGCGHDLQGTGLRLLAPVGKTPKGKPISGSAFWSWADLEDWLLKPPTQPDQPVQPFGLSALQRERRTHVSIDPTTQTAEDSKLFSTEMLRFVRRVEDHKGVTTYAQFSLAFGCTDKGLKEGIGCLGGERRLSMLAKSPHPLPAFPEKKFPKDQRLLRVVLLTPAIFAQGFRPKDPPDATLVAAAVGRPQVISGWDMETQAPKATRRMAPAGSVYWFQLNDNTDPVAWAKQRWLRSLCDDEQDQRDGFGLCAVGVA